MPLENYISQLLFKNQRVVVPDFGAFLSNVKTALSNDILKTIQPPKKSLTFDATDKKDDGVLANTIKHHKRISYDAAISFIREEIANWMDVLQKRQIITIPKLGQFYITENQRLVFLPSDEINFLNSSFGLEVYNMQEAKEHFYKAPEPEPEYLPTVVEVHEEEEFEEIVPMYYSEKRSNNFSMVVYAVVLAIGVVITVKIAYPLYQELIEKKTLLVEIGVQRKVEEKIEQATFSIETPVPSVTLTVNSPTEKNVAAKKPVENYHPPIAQENIVKRYQVVAGLFKTEKEAQKKYDDLKFLCFDPIKLPPNKNGLYPVLYGTYATSAEAAEEMLRIKRTTNRNVWINIEN